MKLLVAIDLSKSTEKVMEKAVKFNPLDEKIQFYSDNLIRVYEKFGPFF